MRTRILNSFSVLGLCALTIAISANAGTSACDEGLSAFTQTVYQKVRRDCVLCHNGQKPQAPPFASSDPKRSYDQLVSYMNFGKIEDSLLVIRAGNYHCALENCDSSSGEEMKALAFKWWESGEKTCKRNGVFFSPELPMPADLPGPNGGFQTLSFDLGAMKADLKGYTFLIDIQNYIEGSGESRGAYRLRAPRIAGGSKSVYVKDIKVLLNGKYDAIYNEFTTVDRVFPLHAIKTPNYPNATPILSGAMLLLLKDSLESPRIGVSFVSIEPRDGVVASCENLERFKSELMPRLTTLNCASCHQPSAAPTMGTHVFDLTQPEERICATATSLMDPQHPRISPLVALPSQGLGGHPILTDVQRYDYFNAIMRWLGKR